MSPYQLLECYYSMTDQEIKAAYKVKAQSAHPDKEGGSEAQFEAIKDAHLMIATQRARKAYRVKQEAAGMVKCDQCRGLGVRIRRRGLGPGSAVSKTRCESCCGSGRRTT